MLFEKISEEEFRKFATLIHEISGIYLKESKMTLLSNRLMKRLKETRMETFQEYYNYVASRRDSNEIVKMINEISTNETYFFRHEKHFESLFSTVLPELINKGKIPVNIWCAGCSTGEEPLTIAMLAKEKGYLDRRYVRIDASDINTDVLDSAKIGIYDDKKFRYMNDMYLRRYFTEVGPRNYRIDKEIVDAVRFFRFNLIKDSVDKKYDIIFCRNVMIYFNKDDQELVVSHFYDALNKGGYFFLGHSESLYFIDSKFKYKKVQDSPLYYKE